MEKGFKYFLAAVSIALIFGIMYVINAPKPAMTVYDKIELEKMVRNLNSDLPREIGTIGTLDSITYTKKTLTYNLSVYGDTRIKQVYKEHYDDFEDLLKYSLVAMNGQRSMGEKFAEVLNNKELNMGFRVYTADGDAMLWKMTGKELKDFVDSCKMSPTTALRTTIDMQIAIANLDLPVRPDDLTNTKSVTLNSLLGDLDESCLPQSITHVEDDIIIVYNIDEKDFDIDQIGNTFDNEENLDNFAEAMTKDADVREFFGLLAISHSNLVIQYEGRTSHKTASIRIPFSILRKYCKVPQNIFLQQ